MRATILKYGLVAGAVAGGSLLAFGLNWDGKPPPAWGMAAGFASMLVALTAVFVGIKHHRDHALGGMIRFWPALGLGLAISAVATACYVLAWEVVVAVVDSDMAAFFADSMVERARAAGATGAELARAMRDAREFEALYRNPLARMGITAVEFLPVGVLVSLVSAAVLRNPRVLPIHSTHA